MGVRLTKAVVTISIDVGQPASDMRVTPSHQHDETCQWLATVLADHRLSVTWCTASPMTANLPKLQPCHEVALVISHDGPADSARRSALDRQLARSVSEAAARGAKLTTLVTSTDWLTGHLDLVSRHGITALRHPADLAAAQAPHRLQPSQLRFGIWSFPVICELPGTSRWLPGRGGRRAVRRTLDRAISEQGLMQLSIDVARLAAAGRAARHVVGRVLGDIAQRRRQGQLDVSSIAATAGRLAQQQESRPSRSILRPAA
jgi:hypothetical protein